MDDEDLAEQISRLEDEIEQFGKTIERCQKITLVSRAAIVIGAVLIAAMLIGLLPFDPMVMIAAIAAVIGGTVVYGSNSSSLKQAMAAVDEAEARRRELIGKVKLRVVGNGAWRRRNGSHSLE
jgi:hypothetical protein